ncbi:hypothetical protein [Spiroplasma chrysopicola]|uniref:Uncharacterized protein n=1 Tax=Spiroplasma chrysopicola DF-1 TaxID=1276227 RepID=R4U4A5_9MOLU|nr:hypothetical protein [Spiroplasma chrysopicola]AGM25398.1 hypothetical protein SCHRY_v1c08220 [Spiroplasma chrysopicola DF-1]
MIQIGILLSYSNGVKLLFEKLDSYLIDLEQINDCYVQTIEEINVGLILELTQFDSLNLSKVTTIFQKIIKAKKIYDFLSLEKKFWVEVKQIILNCNHPKSELYKLFLLYYFTSQAITDFFYKLSVIKC